MTNSDFTPGQRWISNTEPELGLGIIESSDFRTIRIRFPASGEIRMYAKQETPLTRVRFSQHDVLEDANKHTLLVHEAIEQDGLLTYIGEDKDGNSWQLNETQLNAGMKLNKPRDRLLNAQFDKNSSYILRVKTLNMLNTLLPSPVLGLCGPRVSLVPHQLFIAHEVSTRSAPRVLLADEVGLGKTIEAGLIIHQQLLLGRAQRILILVPETLQHQWLVEMLRRFNLRFSIFNEERCAAFDEEDENPFQTEQLVLCSIEFLQQSAKRNAQALAGQWDTLVVDEAHHLQWQPDQASPEYQTVEALSRTTPGVLLLTATPEQLGAAGHFARLRLLDPDRFYSFEEFIEEESLYEPVANAAETLQDGNELNEADIDALHLALADSNTGKELLQDLLVTGNKDQTIRNKLIKLLSDRHGTGRILFRNTRNTIKGFPQRELVSFPLTAPADYLEPILQASREAEPHSDIARFALTPERIYQMHKSDTMPAWTALDPRVDWLYRKLKELRSHKVLVICASPTTVLELEEVLRTRYGLHAAVFHEAMSIIERDRAAAYFADQEQGTPVLICSEIGSEGRNFQFSHHLLLFDLPLNPDLLEQRIGRLDRIGQKHTIQILVPYIENSAQAIMLDWYHQGINAFNKTCPAGVNVFDAVTDDLLSLLQNPAQDASKKEALIAATIPIFNDITLRLQQGRDRLLELNSFREDEALHIVQQISMQNSLIELGNYVELVFDTYGLDHEPRDNKSFVVHPSDHMLVQQFPELPEDGMTYTFDREHALVHEDQHFLSWEHPMLTAAMELILSSEQGNSTLAIIKHPSLKTGDILIEAIFRVEGTAPQKLQISRFLPPTTIRVLVDSKLNDLSHKLAFEKIVPLPVELDPYTLRQIIDSQQFKLRKMMEQAESLSQDQVPEIISDARLTMRIALQTERQRLHELQQVNPNVRNEEIEFIDHQIEQLDEYIHQTTQRLDAIRLIIAA